MHQLGGWTVGRDTLVHGANDAHLIRNTLELREDFADLEAGLTGLLEFERAGEEHAVHASGGHVRELLHLWLRVKRIEVRRGTAGKDVDDVLGLGGQGSLARLEIRHHFGVGVGDHVVRDHSTESERAHTETGLAQKLATGVGGWDVISAVGVFHEGVGIRSIVEGYFEYSNTIQ